MSTRATLSRDPHPLLRQLGQQVRTLRTAHGWTLRELAERCHLSERFLSDVETGRGNPSILNLAELARALEVPLVTLVAPVDAPPERPVIALLGLRGAGKSTLGSRLAERLGLPFLELDALIEEAAGMSLEALFAMYSEGYYRKLELEVLERFLGRGERAVLATGGGIVLSPEAFSLLERGCRLVWLKARAEDHWERVVRQGDQRPMRDNPHAMAELRAMLKAREPLYARAGQVVDTSALGLEGSLEALVAGLDVALPAPADPLS